MNCYSESLDSLWISQTTLKCDKHFIDLLVECILEPEFIL